MKTQGVLFYCDRKRPVAALLVALWTLRRSYEGAIHIVFGPYAPDWLQRIVAEQGLRHCITWDTLVEYDFTQWTNGRRGSWCQKPFIIRRSPFDLTLYLDCDHLFVGTRWRDDIWNQIDHLGIGSAHDHPSVPRGPRIIKDMNAVAGVSLSAYRPVNGGCIGYRRGEVLLDAWINYMVMFVEQRTSGLLKSLAEEYALGLLLNSGRGGWLNAAISRMRFPHADALGYHLNNGRFIETNLWQAALRNCVASDFLGIQRHRHDLIHTDPRLAGLLHVDSLG